MHPRRTKRNPFGTYIFTYWVNGNYDFVICPDFRMSHNAMNPVLLLPPCSIIRGIGSLSWIEGGPAGPHDWYPERELKI